jgi:hypothetical protein
MPLRPSHACRSLGTLPWRWLLRAGGELHYVDVQQRYQFKDVGFGSRLPVFWRLGGKPKASCCVLHAVWRRVCWHQMLHAWRSSALAMACCLACCSWTGEHATVVLSLLRWLLGVQACAVEAL